MNGMTDRFAGLWRVKRVYVSGRVTYSVPMTQDRARLIARGDDFCSAWIVPATEGQNDNDPEER